MASLSSSISDKSWGSVDKTALGNAVAKAFASGDITRGQIKQIYLYVPDECFGKDSEGKPTFAYSKAKFPVAEYSGGAITINRNGVHAAAGALAGARSTPDIPGSAMNAAKRRLRGLYRRLKETAPDNLKESIETLAERGKELTEIVKGSVEYMRDAIERAFNAQFEEPSTYYPNEAYCPWIIRDTFLDFVVVNTYSGRHADELAPDEFYKVGYTREGDTYLFDDYDKWVVVEVAYQAQTTLPTTPIAVPMAENKKPSAKAKRFNETISEAQIEFIESADAETNVDGPWRIKAIGNTAGVTNSNGRRYSVSVLTQAVTELQKHLHESAGQGVLRVRPTGESDHPKDKGNRRALLSETIINWDNVGFNGQHILLEGNLLGTAKGKDFRAQVRGGLKPGISQRGYGDSIMVKEGGTTIEEVTELTITGFDPTLPGDQSDADSAVTFVESRDDPTSEGNDTMTKEELIKFLSEHPELFKGVTKEQVESMNADALKAFEESVRKALGIDASADLARELADAAQARKELAETKAKKAVEEAITEATKALPYGEAMNKVFVESVQAAAPKTPDEVKVLVESKRKEYDLLASRNLLAKQGFTGPRMTTTPVMEAELGVPAFARAAHEITESIVSVGDPFVKRHDWKDLKGEPINIEFARKYLERFDLVYRQKLIAESKQFEEAEASTELNIPYSVSRAIVAEALPELIASSIFDMGVTDQAPTRIFYEAFSGETGYTGTAAAESVDMADQDAQGWVQMANKRVTPGTVVIAGQTEGEDFVIDYANGKLAAVTGGGIGATDVLTVAYSYVAIRKGEGVPIERGKVGLTYKTLEIAADRLSTQINREAMVFSRSQLGWDAVTRTIVSLTNQFRRKVDQGLLYLALGAALKQGANNSGGSWTSSGTDYDVFVRAMGAARNKIAYRYYTPTAHIMSENIGDLIANWEGFTQAGSRPDATLNANGYIGKLKGLPVFQSTEFPDGYALSVNQQIVSHRVYMPLRLDGPHDAFDVTTLKLLPAQEWYLEEFNGSDAPVPEKAAYVVIG